MEAAYRLIKRFKTVLPVLRSRLNPRAPPSETGTNPLTQTIAHLRSLYGSDDPVRAFQLALQADVFATG